MAGGGSTKTTTDTTADPWEGVKPYLLDLFSRSSDQSNVPQQSYPGSTVAPTSDYTTQYMQSLADRAGGTNLTRSAEGHTADLISGKYIGKENPYLDAMIGNFTEDIGASVGDRFAGSGGYGGSPGEKQQVTSEVAKAVTPYLFQTYGAERGAQDNAVKNAGFLDQLGVNNLNLLGQAGQIDQGEQQKTIDDLVNKWNFGQNEPWDRLSKFSQLLSPGTQFSATTGTQTQQGGGASPYQMAGGGIQGLSSLAMMLAFL